MDADYAGKHVVLMQLQLYKNVKEVENMPGRDGTGPIGRGSSRGSKVGFGNAGMTSGMGIGIGGYCVCSKCGEKVAHQQGIPCASVVCPKCGAKMIRDL